MPVPTTPAGHIDLIRRKQELLPKIGKDWGDRIFEEQFRGDPLQDDVDQLMHQLDLLDDEDPDLDAAVLNELIDWVWTHIMNRLRYRITHTDTDPNGEAE